MKKIEKVVRTILHKRVIGFFLGILSIVLLGFLWTYHPSLPSLFNVDSSITVSAISWLTSSAAAFLFYVFGAAAFFVPLVGLYSSWVLIVGRSQKKDFDQIVALGVCIFSVTWLMALSTGFFWHSMIMRAGLVGQGILHLLSFDYVVSYVIASALFVSSFVIFTRLRFVTPIFYGVVLCKKAGLYRVLYMCFRPFVFACAYIIRGIKEVFLYTIGHSLEKNVAIQFDEEQLEQLPSLERIARDAFWHEYADIDEIEENEETNSSEAYKEVVEKVPAYRLPDLNLFTVLVNEKDQDALKEELKNRAQVLEDKLAHFGIDGKVVRIQQGPVVTCFEYQPQIDTKLSRITTLEDDLALALEATSLRILAPIPGTSVVGFEVANKKRQKVLLADSMHSDEYRNFKGSLPLILGKDTIGRQLVVDLAEMPHLLVAGSTGSGKSVALNVMLMSLLCRKTPEELKLILIDPKRLEFSTYADIPHLLFPIVTMPKRAIQVLQWVVRTMEERYEIMSHRSVRNIVDYHKQCGKAAQKGMPYIVVVIDELADLMMTSGKHVEEWLARIAQMARAAGIHMIVATQRPSVDVITGLIKVNFPSRISFRVTSKVDSRTILDETGAEKLLGYGDMLYLDAKASLFKRAHGAYVSDEEIKRIVEYARNQSPAEYLELEERSDHESSLRDEDDELYQDIVQFLGDIDEISISLLQRKFRIGYNRSARLIDILESHGLILPSDGSKMRKVIRDE